MTTDTKALRERLRIDAMRDRVTVYSAKEVTEIADAIECLEAERDAAVAKVDVAEAGYRAAVSKAQWQASTNAELNRHLATVERYRAALAELVACCDGVVTSPEPEYAAWCARNSAAWDAARAALKGEG